MQDHVTVQNSGLVKVATIHPHEESDVAVTVLVANDASNLGEVLTTTNKG